MKTESNQAANSYYLMYRDCIPVHGAVNSLIYDLSRNEIYRIDNQYTTILQRLYENGLPVSELDSNSDTTQFINFLLDQELLFLTGQPRSFPKIDFTYNRNNSIIESVVLEASYEALMNQNINEALIHFFDKMIVEALYIRIPDQVSISEIEQILGLFSTSTVRCIEICLAVPLSENILKELVVKYPRIMRIYCENYHSNIIQQLTEDCYLLGSTEKFFKTGCNPTITKHNLVINRANFIEAQTKNVFYHKKIFLDDGLNIRIHPSYAPIANVLTSSVSQIIDTIQTHSQLWDIKKDEIKICKDCEFRYMCNDSRHEYQVTENATFDFSPNCTYDPYSGQWKE